MSEVVRGDFTSKLGNTRRKIKISVLGSYATSNVLNQRRGQVFNEIYEVCFVKEAAPFASITEEDLEALILSKPDYIVFDLFADVCNNVIFENQHAGEEFIQLLEGTSNSHINVVQQSDEYILQFRRGFDRFSQAVKKRLPNTRIILHHIRMGSESQLSKRHLNVSQDIMNDINVSFFVLEEIVTKYNIKIIDVAKNMKSREEDPRQIKRNYITDDLIYYDRFIGQLNFYCLVDLL